TIAAAVDPPPGATVVLNVTAPQQYDPPPEPTTYSVFGSGYPAGTTWLEFRSTCDLEQKPAVVGGVKSALTTDSCWTQGPQDLLVIATDAAGLVAWGTTLDVPTDPGNFVEVSVAVNQTSLLETDAEITNIPGGATRADIGINPEGETIGEGVN